MIRVRFAPSPTGFLHIGGVRTALFNYLFSRNQQGSFLLRIEDTDRERSRPEFEQEILSSLKWLGLDWDESVIRQSERLSRYQELAQALVSRGLAYEETSENKRALRFKIPPRKTVFHDLVHGEVAFDTALFEDLVILKSDGFPTYHWACVVDDHEMGITHVIRGDDHLSNTPRQILLFEAMGWKAPKYVHLPLILGDDGTPLSKRHGAVSLSSFRERGFIPEGILNYLAFLGWGTEGNQEIYSLNELAEKFSLKRINKANAKFNFEKLEWLNAQHIKGLEEDDYVLRVTQFYEKESKRFPPEKWREFVLLYRSRIKTLQDLRTQAGYFFCEEVSYDPPLREDYLQNKPLKRHLEAWIERVGELSTNDFENTALLEKFTREAAAGWGIEARDLIHPLRFAVTGKTVSPGLFELMGVLGKEICLSRVKGFLNKK